MEGQPNSAMSCKGDHSKMSFTCGPHIHVTCTHCGYEWYTLPLDEGIG